MKRKLYLLSVFLLLSSNFIFAKEESQALVNEKSLITWGGDHSFSMGLKYAGKGLRVQGIGLAVALEQQISNFLSIKLNANPALTYTFGTGVATFSYDAKFDAYFYPFFNGMDKLYLGASGGINWYNYFGSGVEDGHTFDVIYSIAPIVGWRQDFCGFLEFDVFGGWRFVFNEGSEDLPEYVLYSTKAGPEYGFKFKFKFGSFIKWYAQKKIEKVSNKFFKK